jgi:hypothetical protein
MSNNTTRDSHNFIKHMKNLCEYKLRAHADGHLKHRACDRILDYMFLHTGYATNNEQWVKFTQNQLAKRLQFSQSEIQKALAELIRMEFLYKAGKGLYVLNDEYAYVGAEEDKAKLVAIRHKHMNKSPKVDNLVSKDIIPFVKPLNKIRSKPRDPRNSLLLPTDNLRVI